MRTALALSGTCPPSHRAHLRSRGPHARLLLKQRTRKSSAESSLGPHRFTAIEGLVGQDKGESTELTGHCREAAQAPRVKVTNAPGLGLV